MIAVYWRAMVAVTTVQSYAPCTCHSTAALLLLSRLPRDLVAVRSRGFGSGLIVLACYRLALKLNEHGFCKRSVWWELQTRRIIVHIDNKLDRTPVAKNKMCRRALRFLEVNLPC